MYRHVKLSHEFLNQLLFVILFTAILIVNSTNVFGQSEFGKVKCDSFQFTTNLTQALIFNKKKVGVYDLFSESYLIKPKKNGIIYLAPDQLYLSINQDELILNYFEKGSSIFQFSDTNLTSFYARFPAETSADYNAVVDLNGEIVNYHTGDQLQTSPNFMKGFVPETFFELNRLDQNRFIINYQRSPVEPLKIIDEVYVVDSGFAKAGVYNIATKKWEISPIYKVIEKRDSLLFCLHETSNFGYRDAYFEDPFVWYNYAYDIYVQRGDNWVIKADHLTGLTAENVCNLMDWDSAELLADNVHVISTKNGKKGLWQFELFHESIQSPHHVELRCNELLLTEFDYLKLNDDTLVFTLKRGVDKPITLYLEQRDENGKCELVQSISAEKSIFYGQLPDPDKRVQLIADDQLRDIVNWTSLKNPIVKLTVREPIHKYQFQRGYGISIINDSLLYCMDFLDEYFDPFTPPINSLFFPDEDSLRYNESTGYYDAVYPPPIRGFDRTGVYNLNTKSWFINPIYTLITENQGLFLCKDVLDQKNGYALNEVHYSLQNLAGEYLFENRPYSSISENFNQYKSQFFTASGITARPFPERSIYNANRDKTFRQEFYVQTTDSTWQIYQFMPRQDEIQILPISKVKELIHYCPTYDYFVYLANDSIFIEFDTLIYGLPSKNGKIEVEIQNYLENYQYGIRLYENEEMRLIPSPAFDTVETFGQKATYYLDNNRFIINENFRFNNLEQVYWDYDYYWPDPPIKVYQNFDTETSLIWEKTTGSWSPKTPYYASIEKATLGYLVRTGFHEVLDPKSNQLDTVSEARVILLNHNLKPLSFMDYFDFDGGAIYDFGISLCTETGCFLISNSGKVITNAEWDTFELENGRIKAIRYKPFDYEMFWEFDDVERIEKVEYFDLPRE